VISALVFNAIIIQFLIPLALYGVPFRPRTAIDLLRRNLLMYGLGGLVSAFVGIKLVYVFLAWLETQGWVQAMGAAVGHFLPLGGL